MPRTVTISASYGAYGDKIARTLADRLDLPALASIHRPDS
jgi:hypothetical protein